MNKTISLPSPCTSQHKHEQKDRTKTFVKAPDHTEIDYMLYRRSIGISKAFVYALLFSFLLPINLFLSALGTAKDFHSVSAESCHV